METCGLGTAMGDNPSYSQHTCRVGNIETPRLLDSVVMASFHRRRESGM